MANESKPVLTQATYRPKKGKEQQLLDLVKRHWSVLQKTGLATQEPATIYRATSKSGLFKKGKVFFIEIFSWIDGEASGRAHQLPEVMAIWEPMGAVLEGGRPELAILEPVAK